MRTKHIGKDFFAALKQITGGELDTYTDLLKEARAEAMERMQVDANAAGANAVVGLRITTSSVAPGACEILCYGTAVVFEEA